MAKIISIGAAVQDVFLSGKALTPVLDEGEWVEELKLGEKFDVDKIVFSTGGGATNAAVTFARQGHKSEFMGVIGHDPAGEAVLLELKKENVSTENIIFSKSYNTGYSVLLLAPSGERTILTYRGASTHYNNDDFDLDGKNADWIYLSSLTGNFDLLEYILTAAEEMGAKVAMDPGKLELKSPEMFLKYVPRLTLLKANRDELSKLVNATSSEEIARELSGKVKYVCVTDGSAGSVLSDGKQIVSAGMYEDVKVVDRTGAGDAFGSGLVSSLAGGSSLQEAITFASANSTAVVGYIGAKKGILYKDAEIHDMPLKTIEL